MSYPEPDLIKSNGISFLDTKTAFAWKSDRELRFSYLIFRMMQSRLFVLISSFFSLLALKLSIPVAPLIKATVFKQFCGGETMDESRTTINKLGKSGIGAILDFAVEGSTKEFVFDETQKEILRVIAFAKENPHVPFACLKPSGIANVNLLEKVSGGGVLTSLEIVEFENVERRLDEICTVALNCRMPIYIDAEESWIQPAIDKLAEKMMRKYNKERAIVSTTLQMYRTDRLAYLEKLINDSKENNYVLGVKIVRGAYIEKEGKRALEFGYPTPINESKPKTDEYYNTAMKILASNINHVEFCAGTHNEESCHVLINEMKQKGIPNNHPGIWFSQLNGMSDHISFNLAAAGYNVTKYLPYGPVKSTIPYLVRRAQENSAIAGQMGKELILISKEIKRRKNKS